MSTTFKTVRTILDTQLETVSNLPHVQKENVLHTPNNTSFVRATLLPSRTEIASLGVNGYDRLNGLYQIDVFFKKDQGTDDVATMVDAILNAFIKGAHLTSGAVKVLVENKYPDPARILQNFYVVPVIVEWSSYQT